ncbi:MAG: HAD-IA family hydrolase [Candidatus Saccharibacteria bacterium]
MKHVIFDFDGTLVDSLPVVVRIANQVVPQLNIDDHELAKIREMPAREIIKYSGIPNWQLLRLIIKGKKIMAQHLDELKLFKGIDAVIVDLHKKDFKLSVVSSNSEENIRKVLKSEGVEEYFTGVYGNVGLFSKARVFKTVLKDMHISASQAIYVGDEVRDIEAARKIPIDVISVTWGYNGEQILKKYKPTYLAKTLQQLQTVLTETIAA